MPKTERLSDDVNTDSTPWCRDHRGRTYSLSEFLQLTQAFHGYSAPGVIIGAKMVEIATKHLPSGILFDAICESSKCLPDAVQLLTPCTMGNGWLQIVPLGRYALTLYNKNTGHGIRVYVDPTQLENYPETHYWFFGNKPKRKDKSDILIREIHQAQEEFYRVQEVRIRPEFYAKKPSDRRVICPHCGEAYPAGHGSICRGCNPETGYILKEEMK
jgi:formylmethanofuran dehydrogenase subunit E